jgi:hypothetical protein
MTCTQCGLPIPDYGRRDQVFCTNNCRQQAYRSRRKTGLPPLPRWQHPALRSDDPTLRAAAERADEHGEAYGWSSSTTRCTMDGLTVVLAGRPAGERVPLTDIWRRTSRHTSSRRVAEVLAGMALLHDDTTVRFISGSALMCARSSREVIGGVTAPSRTSA